MSKSSVSGKEKAGDVTNGGDDFKLVAPDGGYAWVVAFAHFLIIGSSVPVQIIFGLLYRDIFIRLNFSPTDISLLMNVNFGIGQGFALFNGPLIRRYGYRKMAVVGAILLSGGMAGTSVAVTIPQCMLAYGIIASLGFGIVLQSSQVAFNAYFKEKKSKAMGMAMTAVGGCMILMPQLVVFLLKTYGPRGACLIVTGVTMQAFVGTALLQPVKRHMKKKILDPEQPLLMSQGKINTEEKSDVENNDTESSVNPTNTLQSGDERTAEEKLGNVAEPALNPSNNVPPQVNPAPGVEQMEEQEQLLDRPDEDPPQEGDKMIEENNVRTSRPASLRRTSNSEGNEEEKIRKKGILRVILSKIWTVLDLSLLTNVVYANVIVGMSLAFASETNFSFMTPLILASMGFSTDGVATLMSTMAIIDLLARFVTPFALGRFKINARIIYFVSIILLVIFRSFLVFLSTFESVMMLGVGLGIAKGIRNVYILLVIPAYVPLERLPSAIGLQMAISAVLFLFFGLILGKAVEKGGYDYCVLAINALTLITIVMWLVEMVGFRKKRSDPEAGNTS